MVVLYPSVDIISSTHCYPEARAWSTFYANRMQAFVHLMGVNTSYVDLGINWCLYFYFIVLRLVIFVTQYFVLWTLKTICNY